VKTSSSGEEGRRGGSSSGKARVFSLAAVLWLSKSSALPGDINGCCSIAGTGRSSSSPRRAACQHLVSIAYEALQKVDTRDFVSADRCLNGAFCFEVKGG
jgi:hypothetical protein